MPKFIAYPGMSGYYLPTTTFRQLMRSQLASQLANEEPTLFVHIWEICPYILQRQQQWTDSKGNTTILDISH